MTKTLIDELREYCEGRGVCDCRRILEILSRHAEPKEEGLREHLIKMLRACRKNKADHRPSDKYWHGQEQAYLEMAEHLGIKCGDCHGEGMIGAGSEGLVYCSCDMGVYSTPTPAKAEEPLEELLKRKGCQLVLGSLGSYVFLVKAVAQVKVSGERDARAWLEKQPDVTKPAPGQDKGE